MEGDGIIIMFTRDELIDLYINKNMSQRDIAKYKKCGKSTVNWYFRKFDIKTMSVKEKTFVRNKRKCSTCKIDKSLDSFYKASNNYSGFHNICKKCSLDYNRRWEANNKDKIYIKNHKRRSLRKEVEENFSETDIEIMFEIFGRKCFNCNSTKNITIDHVFPLSDKNSLSLINATPLCKSCNSRKYNKCPVKFFDNRFVELTALMYEALTTYRNRYES